MLVALSIGMIGFGQTTKAFAYSVSFNFDNEGWSDYSECKIPISINLDNQIIIINSNVQQSFLIEDGETHESVSNGEIIIFYCIDQHGKYCEIWITEPGSDGLSGFFVFYKDMSIGYKVRLG